MPPISHTANFASSEIMRWDAGIVARTKKKYLMKNNHGTVHKHFRAWRVFAGKTDSK